MVPHTSNSHAMNSHGKITFVVRERTSCISSRMTLVQFSLETHLLDFSNVLYLRDQC
jgi:hypothetical protein